jgi:hypothetical protein
MLWFASAAERQIRLKSPSPTGNVRIIFQDSAGINQGQLYLSDTGDDLVLNGSDGLLLNGLGATGLQLYGGAPLGISNKWPTNNGNPGDLLTLGAAGAMSWAPPTGGAPAISSVQSYPVATIDASFAPWTGVSGGQGNLYLTALVPTGNSVALAQGALSVLQTAAGAGGVGIGIYDSAGLLLSHSLTVPSVLGFQVIPLLTPVSLTGGVLYYLAAYSNRNGVFLGSRNAIVSTPAGTPPMGFNVPNSGAQPGAVNGFPPNISAFFGNMNAIRPWVQIAV